MSPEYGATCGFFPIDGVTLEYLRGTGRDAAQVELVERYAKAQGLFRTDDTPDPVYSDNLELDMGDVIPSLAGPKRPQDRVVLSDMRDTFRSNFGEQSNAATLTLDEREESLEDGKVVIASITSLSLIHI